MYAIELHIAVTIEMTEEISEISVDALDLSRVLGIFLDNAIETALETEHPSIRFAAISLDTEYLLFPIPISTMVCLSLPCANR